MHLASIDDHSEGYQSRDEVDRLRRRCRNCGEDAGFSTSRGCTAETFANVIVYPERGQLHAYRQVIMNPDVLSVTPSK